MALKRPIPKLDKRGVALARARFQAWWDGKDFDEAAALSAIEATANANEASVDGELFDEGEPAEAPRLEALQRIWGKGRIAPGDEAAEGALPARLDLAATATLGVFSPGLAAPVVALAATHPGEIRVFEWREETLPGLRHGLGAAGLAKRVSLSGVDLETFSAPADAFDGLVSFDDFTFADNASRVALQFARALKPKARGVIETYCGLPGAETQSAFATAFAEFHLRADGDIAAMLDEAGLRVEAMEDTTEAHLVGARAGFRRLAEALRAEGALPPLAARELAWESESWRSRVQLLTARRIERRAFTVVKKA